VDTQPSSFKKMFNFGAETFVILYPYAAGGRFLQMAMSLDPTVTAVHTDLFRQPSREHLFEEYKRGLTSGHNNAHFNGSGHLPDYIPENINHAERYVFCIHQAELQPATALLHRCQNLKIFIINISTNESVQQLKTRRWFFAQRIILPLRDSYKLHAKELHTINSVNETLKFRIGAFPIGSIELEDYWNPEKAILLLNQFFAEHNLNCNRWEELYAIWHANAIEATLNDIPSNCQKELDYLSRS
jgi:hypothetical protein